LPEIAPGIGFPIWGISPPNGESSSGTSQRVDSNPYDFQSIYLHPDLASNLKKVKYALYLSVREEKEMKKTVSLFVAFAFVLSLAAVAFAAEPAKTTEPAKMGEPAKAGEPAKMGEPMKKEEAVKKAAPAKKAKPAKKAVHKKKAAPAKKAEPEKKAEPMKKEAAPPAAPAEKK
jgi:hypothetical protein